MLQLDKGAEFHSDALERDCSQSAITLHQPPPARPHFGSQIERLIGTVMGRVHLLQGTTDAPPAHRGGYGAEQEARMTLNEFAEWLTLEIAGRSATMRQYHSDLASSIGFDS